jgi:hypothetical protein
MVVEPVVAALVFVSACFGIFRSNRDEIPALHKLELLDPVFPRAWNFAPEGWGISPTLGWK